MTNPVYSPGNQVSYSVKIVDHLTGKQVKDRNVLLSVTVTDESVFSKVEARKQPPSLGAAILLENEVDRTNYEFFFANEYIDQWFQSNATAGSCDANIELLLGTQGWRANIFDLPRVYDIS